MYLAQRTGTRLEPDGSGMPHHKVGKIYGSGKAGKIFGGAKLGLMPGEHLVPHHHMSEAIHNYKTLNNLHHRRHHPMILPGLHPLHIIQRTLHHSESQNPKGGLLPAFLPLAAGAAMPFISEAIKGLLGGMGKSGGEHLVNRLAGSGVPMPCGPPHERHYKIHGEGFKDILKKAVEHMHKMLKSEPVRKFGTKAIETLRESFQNAIIHHLEELAAGASKKFNNWYAKDGADEGAAELQPDAPSSEDEFVDARGEGLKRRKKRAPMTHKKKRNYKLHPVY